MYLESCCTNLEEVKEACDNGASRIELCERIDLGGITPSRKLLCDVLSVSTIPINVMIRPRGGNFVYSEDEINQMLEYPPNRELGDFALPCFKLSKTLRCSPVKIAENLAKRANFAQNYCPCI